MQNRYSKTILVSSIGDFSGIRIGQWVQTEMGSKGQYLGQSKAGVTVIRWQSGKFDKSDAFNNAHLRRFALSKPTK